MAHIGNQQRSQTQTKVYATDEAGMMKDAKDYASRDYKATLETFRKAGIPKEQCSDEVIAKSLILVKLNQIKEARLGRVTYFD